MTRTGCAVVAATIAVMALGGCAASQHVATATSVRPAAATTTSDPTARLYGVASGTAHLIDAGIVALHLNDSQALIYQVSRSDGPLLLDCATALHELDEVRWPAKDQAAESRAYASIEELQTSLTDPTGTAGQIVAFNEAFGAALKDLKTALPAFAASVADD